MYISDYKSGHKKESHSNVKNEEDFDGKTLIIYIRYDRKLIDKNDLLIKYRNII